MNNIRNIKLFLSGKKGQVITSLEKEMHSHAKKHEFELAEIAKKKIFALNHINDIALIKDTPRMTGEGFRIEYPTTSLTCQEKYGWGDDQ
jgi:excinuclease UvrABC nuclease subunit